MVFEGEEVEVCDFRLPYRVNVPIEGGYEIV